MHYSEAKSFADKKSQTFDRASSLNVLSSALRASFAARLAFSIVSLRVRVALAPDVDRHASETVSSLVAALASSGVASRRRAPTVASASAVASTTPAPESEAMSGDDEDGDEDARARSRFRLVRSLREESSLERSTKSDFIATRVSVSRAFERARA